ncbi:Radical SAM [Methanospirillum hungatei JF-1]|uniref:Radical SAM n=1 Tax=Methanospirillum hungatei JF-1 (strain ATCC 27890 / DSM 864 / NBRC 100397 / JF-1) TaxID=323259 RepID=Q2FMG8_METHJ|nr:radical SAM protein [Methanospirillum hungatei]ABD41710.1 Radical SAM [Methanospirillum hungatei JF-1]MBP9007293.1 radical SAM protein [Methanospirillum sp.]HOW03983.1 radical SAM protein [Methanospirillum hungatei]
MECEMCGHRCSIQEGGYGRCRMYTCKNGEISERFPDLYLALWPGAIETIPFLHYTPGGRYLLLSTIGCNLSCEGCVSYVLAKNQDLLTDALIHAEPTDVLRMARDNACIGAVFCLNEPTVSLETVARVARELHAAGLSMGCASNGCMSEKALDVLLDHMDFITIGLKGLSDQAYQINGAPCNAEQVFQTLKTIHSRNIHLEVAAVCKTSDMEEIVTIAQRILEISADIPLLVMRFIPFHGADTALEPSAIAAEDLISACRKYLPFVYLFNTPSTRYLNTYCPNCNELLVERSFNGPMGARFSGRYAQVCPSCTSSIPIRGEWFSQFYQEPRFRGGYRTPVALDMVYSILKAVSISDEATMGMVLTKLLSNDYLEQLQTRLQTPKGYIEFLQVLQQWSGSLSFEPVIRFLSGRVQIIERYSNVPNKPRVLSVLSHPLLPSYPDKMENTLIALAGGDVLNYDLGYDEKSSERFTWDAFQKLKPDILVVSGPGHLTHQDFVDLCMREDLTAPAIEENNIFMVPGTHLSAGPSWILTLESIANYLHPDIFDFNLEYEKAVLLKTLPGLE